MWSVRKYSLVDALFRTISVMATGADMHEQDFDSDWQKVFAATLRILGAALTAAFTAIVTNYLLRARLGGALEVRRLPDGGHVIICGLGNIGFRVVQELIQSETRVVAIERSGDNPFVTTARRLGAPVLVGDATVREVLRQAHAPTSRAVVAATTNDLVNLEIALLVRELNPQQRVVLCLADASLAESLREAASVRLSLSVPALAAPAFVAGLFGDRVLSVFLLQARLLAAIDLIIQPSDSSLAGQSVRAVSVDYRLVPVALFAPGGTLQHEPLEARLDAGWRLLAILALPDLERLLRREPQPGSWVVEVTALPDKARPRVTELLQVHRGVQAEAAVKLLDHAPVAVARNLTRGQAEDLLVRLRREEVEAVVRRQGNSEVAE
jgi:Trk K+ transport system NAD-binding subunit